MVEVLAGLSTMQVLYILYIGPIYLSSYSSCWTLHHAGPLYLSSYHLIPPYLSSCYYVCARATMYVSSYYYMCVLILLLHVCVVIARTYAGVLAHDKPDVC